MKDLVPSLDTCKQLKEAGFPQETLSYWMLPNEVERKFVGSGYKLGRLAEFGTVNLEEYYAAPTAEEILRELREEIVLNERTYYFQVSRTVEGGWAVHYEDTDMKSTQLATGKTLSEAAANMYLYLKKEGLL